MDSIDKQYRDKNIELDAVYEQPSWDHKPLKQRNEVEKFIQDYALLRNYESNPIKKLDVLRSRLGPFQTYVFDRLRGLDPPDIASEVAREENIEFGKAYERVWRALGVIRMKAKLIRELYE